MAAALEAEGRPGPARAALVDALRGTARIPELVALIESPTRFDRRVGELLIEVLSVSDLALLGAGEVAAGPPAAPKSPVAEFRSSLLAMAGDAEAAQWCAALLTRVADRRWALLQDLRTERLTNFPSPWLLLPRGPLALIPSAAAALADPDPLQRLVLSSRRDVRYAAVRHLARRDDTRAWLEAYREFEPSLLVRQLLP